jgi:hypothetical protein
MRLRHFMAIVHVDMPRPGCSSGPLRMPIALMDLQQHCCRRCGEISSARSHALYVARHAHMPLCS